jgi:hypothetical protein
VKTKFIEVTNGPMNWGKFAVCWFELHEWLLRSEIPMPALEQDDPIDTLVAKLVVEKLGVEVGEEPPPETPRPRLLTACGWTPKHVWVLDLQTGEGAFFAPGGLASADLEKHRVWVCPMFEPFLTWLYKQDLSDLDALPGLVNFTQEEAPFAMSGYRRPGPKEV